MKDLLPFNVSRRKETKRNFCRDAIDHPIEIPFMHFDVLIYFFILVQSDAVETLFYH